MRRAWVINIGLTLWLSGSFLVGCGDRNATPEPTPTEPEATVPERGDVSAEPDAADPSTSGTPATEPSTSGNGTAINPPKAASLKAQQADAQINLRSQPTTAAESPGYGLVGDPVKLLRAAEGADGLTWYFVKFDESGAEGWIRGDFINTSGTSANLNQRASASIDAFTTDEIFAVGSGGCGMTLWPVGSPDEYIFFNGLPDTGMWMKLDGTMTEFRRTAASGPEFYGQSASQSFVSSNGAITVDVTASVGSEEGYESVNIQQGRLVLKGPAGTTEIAVAGDAGC